MMRISKQLHTSIVIDALHPIHTNYVAILLDSLMLPYASGQPLGSASENIYNIHTSNLEHADTTVFLVS